MADIDFEKEWRSRYTYSRGDSVHVIRLQQSDDSIVANSLPNEEQSELSMELSLDENILSGTWRERTSPSGPYRGEIFHGVVQFAMDEERTKAEGKWLGFNRDRTKINLGNWILEQEQK